MSSNIIVGRTRARSQAIQIVFQAEIQGVDIFDLVRSGEYALDDGPAAEYALTLAKGVAVNRIAIDRLTGAVSKNWNLSRMPLVDRCVMAVAIYELFCQPEIPASVAISEAVELSKVYGTDDSSSFVNGILGRVARLAEANPGVELAPLARLVASGEAVEPAENPAPVASVAPAPADGSTEGEAGRAVDEVAAPAEEDEEPAVAGEDGDPAEEDVTAVDEAAPAAEEGAPAEAEAAHVGA